MKLSNCNVPFGRLATTGLAAFGLATAAFAQSAPSTPAKSQAAPPSIVIPAAPKSSKPKTLGGKGMVQGKLLSREELRACMARLDAVNNDTKQVEQQRAALDGEKPGLTKSGEELKAEREEVERKLAAVREWEGRLKSHGTEVDAFNKRSATFDDTPRDKREALKAELDAERERLSKAREGLAADEARLVPVYQTSVKAYNEKALARDAKVNDWNQRNAAANDSAKKLDDARNAWLLECADRPYREDDEIAIKSGKK